MAFKSEHVAYLRDSYVFYTNFRMPETLNTIQSPSHIIGIAYGRLRVHEEDNIKTEFKLMQSEDAN